MDLEQRITEQVKQYCLLSSEEKLKFRREITVVMLLLSGFCLCATGSSKRRKHIGFQN